MFNARHNKTGGKQNNQIKTVQEINDIFLKSSIVDILI